MKGVKGYNSKSGKEQRQLGQTMKIEIGKWMTF